MITLIEARNEYERLTGAEEIGMFATGLPGTMGSKSSSKQKNQAVFINQVIKYLENNPSEDFVESEYKKVIERIRAKEKDLPVTDTLTSSVASGIIKKYREENQMPKLEAQLNILKFLLKK